MIFGKPKKKKDEWHKWYAWHPVRLGLSGDGKCAWLETIERKEQYSDNWCWFVYRQIQPIILLPSPLMKMCKEFGITNIESLTSNMVFTLYNAWCDGIIKGKLVMTCETGKNTWQLTFMDRHKTYYITLKG